MQYQIQGQPYPVVVLTVEPEETVLCQKGAMAWMTPNMEMQTKGGGLGKMFSRAFTGESMFQNHYTAKGGQGMIAFASAVPGEIMPVQISPERSIVAQKSAFLASEVGVHFELFFQKKLAGGFFGGEGFIMQKFSGNGMLFLEVDGSMVAYDLAPGQSMMVDTGNLAAMEATCTIDVEMVKGVGNMLLGGEGLFNTKVTGPGRIWLQTLPLSGMAGALAKVMPSSTKLFVRLCAVLFFCMLFREQYSPVAAGGGSPLTLRPNFNCEKGNVTAAAAACLPRRGSFVGV